MRNDRSDTTICLERKKQPAKEYKADWRCGKRKKSLYRRLCDHISGKDGLCDTLGRSMAKWFYEMSVCGRGSESRSRPAG